MAIDIFSWAAMEPAEGEFTFGWLEQVLERFRDNGILRLAHNAQRRASSMAVRPLPGGAAGSRQPGAQFAWREA